MYTIYNENEEMMTLLLRHGCDTDVKNKLGDTPLLHALKCKSAQSVKKLLAYGCKVNVTDMDGWSPLLLAIETRSFHLIKLLIDGGAELDYKGPAGKTALLLATELYLPDIVGYLLCMGSNKAATCNKGWDALIYATRMGSLPMVKLLLDKHCFPDHRDTAGKTALLHAVEVKNRSGIIHSLSGRGPEVIRTLLTYGSDINAKDGIGMNALLYATEDENADTVKILLDHNCKLEHRKPSSGLTAFLIAFNNEQSSADSLFPKALSLFKWSA